MKTFIIVMETFVMGVLAGVGLMWVVGYSSPDVRNLMERGSEYFAQI